MAAPTFVIGLGGTGAEVLVRVKERLLEAYDEVPSQVNLLLLDTDDYTRNTITFNGVRLAWQGDQVEDEQLPLARSEFFHVATDNPTDTIDNVITRKDRGDREWQWINQGRLDRTLTGANNRVISAGAATVRPVGRSALFMRYGQVYHLLQDRLTEIIRLVPDGDNGEAVGNNAGRRATVFVTGSVAGGSGAGMIVDVLSMIKHIREQPTFRGQAIEVIALLLGGSSFTDVRELRLASNTFAALREIDRLGAVAGRQLSKAVPPILEAPQPVYTFRSSLAPADMVMLFDKPDREGSARNHERDYRLKVVVPTLADLIVAYADDLMAGKLQTTMADRNANFLTKDPGIRAGSVKDGNGFFPYCSAGMHTLIYPERDVRMSAGLKFLLEMWRNVLVKKDFSTEGYGKELLEISANLWNKPANKGLGTKRVVPTTFVDQGFGDIQDICRGVSNNGFIQNVVDSSLKKHIDLPPKGGFLVWGGKTILNQSLAIAGVPSSMRSKREVKTTFNVDDLSVKLEGQIEADIDQLKGLEDAESIIEWRRTFLGDGSLGSERDGQWFLRLLAAETVTKHKFDFRDILTKVVLGILNDVDEIGQKIPHRLEYGICVLKRLEEHVDHYRHGSDRNPSLISDRFRAQTNAIGEPERKIKSTESDALKGSKLASYRTANVKYAEAKRDLLGSELLEFLCDELKLEIKKLAEELRQWRVYFDGTQDLIAKQQNAHENQRLEKGSIPVRTYLVKLPSAEKREKRYYCDGDHEIQLYAKHHDAAEVTFRTGLKWVMTDDGYKMIAPFADPEKETLSQTELVTRAVTWAGTAKGNWDQPDSVKPFKDLGTPAEVQLAAHIYEYFGLAGTAQLVQKLTNPSSIAALCPLSSWPNRRNMMALGLPRISVVGERADRFYDRVHGDFDVNRGQKGYFDRLIFPTNHELENKRHAFAIEFAFGFKLEDRTDYLNNLGTYLRDTNNYNALHCLPEEDVASTYYEVELRPNSHKEIFNKLGLPNVILDPAVVDLLGNQKRLRHFIRALAWKQIDKLPAALQTDTNFGLDYFLFPTEGDLRRVRLSRMTRPEDTRNILEDFAQTGADVPLVMAKTKTVNRIRLLYALRTFVFANEGVPESNVQEAGAVLRRIDVTEVETRIHAIESSQSFEKRQVVYEQWRDKALGFYTDHKNEYPVLAHLGLVLAREFDDLRASNVNPGGGNEV